MLRRSIKPKKLPKVTAIIVAGGKGERMGTPYNKIFAEINGHPMISYTLEAFELCPFISEIIITTREEDIIGIGELVEDFEFQKVKTIVSGGKTRSDSVLCGLREISSTDFLDFTETSKLSKTSNYPDYVAIHDAARPLITPQLIEKVVDEAFDCPATALGCKVKDTIKIVNKTMEIIDTPARDNMFIIQTPQVFEYSVIKSAYDMWLQAPFPATDDCMLVEKMGVPIKVVLGSYENIKITTKEDLIIAKNILSTRERL